MSTTNTNETTTTATATQPEAFPVPDGTSELPSELPGYPAPTDPSPGTSGSVSSQ